MDFVVVDVETTGLFPNGHDRIIEIGAVRMDPELRVVDEFTSLVNPERDIGPTHVHGIRAGEAMQAPLFSDIAGLVSDTLEGAVLVGHNVGFDLRFLLAEYGRLGFEIMNPLHVDTMRLAVVAGCHSRGLSEACDVFGIAIEGQHSALGDARATSELFRAFSDQMGAGRIRTFVSGQMPEGPRVWPARDVYGDPLPRGQSEAPSESARSFLSRLVEELPASSSESSERQAYFALLDRALEDRRFSQNEKTALRELALMGGLSQTDVEDANETYLRTLVGTALADGVISDAEREDLDEVARILSLEDALDGLISEVRGQATSNEPVGGDLPDLPLSGRTVCFTGALNGVLQGERVTRERASEIAKDHGMKVVRSVTKKLDYLVMADPDSMSGKAKKARSYGTRILAESTFWRAVGVQVQ